MNAPDARWQSRQLEALAAATVRCAEALVRAVADAPPPLGDMARLTVLDAENLLRRVHGLRRRIESEVTG